MPAGYSGTPLIKNPGINGNSRLLLIHAPENYFDLLEADISGQVIRQHEIPDLVHVFVKTKKELEDAMRPAQTYAHQNPQISIWVSWYKKSSGMVTDVTENSIRRYALQHGLVDVKVCAVSDLWSGLKLVVPLSERKRKH